MVYDMPEKRKFDAQKRLDYYNALKRRYDELRQANYTPSRIVDSHHRKIQLVEGDKYTTLYRISAGQHYVIKEAVNNYIRANSKVMIKSDFREKISKQL